APRPLSLRFRAQPWRLSFRVSRWRRIWILASNTCRGKIRPEPVTSSEKGVFTVLRLGRTQLDQAEYQRVLAAEATQARAGLSYCPFNTSSMVTISTNPE